jgi:hypothetical protein
MNSRHADLRPEPRIAAEFKLKSYAATSNISR